MAVSHASAFIKRPISLISHTVLYPVTCYPTTRCFCVVLFAFLHRAIPRPVIPQPGIAQPDISQPGIPQHNISQNAITNWLLSHIVVNRTLLNSIVSSLSHYLLYPVIIPIPRSYPTPPAKDHQHTKWRNLFPEKRQQKQTELLTVTCVNAAR